jgi:hypothetical protein
MAFTENDIEEFHKFLTRQPPYTSIGGAITTWPNGDANQRAIYERCEELERRGLAVRREIDRSTVIFSAVEEQGQ